MITILTSDDTLRSQIDSALAHCLDAIEHADPQHLREIVQALPALERLRQNLGAAAAPETQPATSGPVLIRETIEQWNARHSSALPPADSQ
ncbi:MAG: hypothetical protein ACRD0Y_04705 [Terriglobales bacterium]